MTAKQRLFVREYQVDCNATQAAIRAGYSAKTAQEQGSRLLSNVMVSAAIAEGRAARMAALDITAEVLDRESGRIATSNIKELFDENGRPRSVRDLPEDVAAAVSSVKVTERRVNAVCVDVMTEFKFWDKNVAIRTLHQRKGDLTDNKNVNVKGELSVGVKRIVDEDQISKWPTEMLVEYNAHTVAQEAIRQRAKAWLAGETVPGEAKAGNA